MPKLLNKSSKMVTIPFKNKDGIVVRVILNSLKLTQVSLEYWKVMQNVFLVKKMLNDGTLLEGAAANRESVDDNEVFEEMKKDLNDDELTKLAS